MEKETLYQQIEDFLEGHLSTEERTTFEEKLASDVALKEEVELHQALQNSLGNKQADAFAAQLDELGNQYTPPLHQSRTIKWYWIAAAAVILIFGGWFIYHFTPEATPQALFATHYQSYPLSSNLRSDTKVEFTDYQKGLEAYQAQKYPEALKAFEQGSNPKPPLILLLQAICLLELDNPQGAIPSLQTLILGADHLYQNEAKWYLVLAYLATDQPEKSRPLLKELSVLRSKTGEQAKSILEELD